MEAYDDYAELIELPKDLWTEVRSHLLRNSDGDSELREAQRIFLEISPSLRQNFAAQVAKDLFRNIFFFKGKSPLFFIKILPLLKQLNLDKDDVIYYQGDRAGHLYFIKMGMVALHYDLSEGMSTDAKY